MCTAQNASIIRYKIKRVEFMVSKHVQTTTSSISLLSLPSPTAQTDSVSPINTQELTQTSPINTQELTYSITS
nr:4527_t:CDS:2 [Entrophospora candida]